MKKSVRSVFTSTAVIISTLFIFGCSKNSSDDSSFSLSQDEPAADFVGAIGTFTGIYNQSIVSSNCVSCHSPAGTATQINGVELDFSTKETAYRTLTGGKTMKGSSRIGSCGSVALIAPGQPYNSYFAGVLIPEFNADDFAGVSGCTPYSVHLQDMNLSSEEQASIVAWIQAGASNN